MNDPKYENYAQRIQGVSQVCDPELPQSCRLFLMTLGAFSVSSHPHPGNRILMTNCGVKTRQGLNKIARKLIEKKLIEIVEIGNGRGHATVYRLCTEDPRYPAPKTNNKPATPELPVLSTENGNLQAENGNPQLGRSETRNSGVAHGFRTDLRTDKPGKGRLAPPSSTNALSSSQRRWNDIRKLGIAAEELWQGSHSIPGYTVVDLVEDVKCYAAQNGIEYFDGLAGRTGIVHQAVELAIRRINS